MKKKTKGIDENLIKRNFVKFLNAIYKWFLRKNLVVKVIIVAVFIIIIIVGGKFGFLGIQLQRNIENVIDSFPSYFETKKKQKLEQKINEIFDIDSINKTRENGIIKLDYEQENVPLYNIETKEPKKSEEQKTIEDEDIINIPDNYITIENEVNVLIKSEQVVENVAPNIHEIKKSNKLNEQIALKEEKINVQILYYVNYEFGKNKMICREDDYINIYYQVDKQCYISFISVDSKGIIGLGHDGRIEPKLYEPTKERTKYTEFNLDGAEGFEVYYAIATFDSTNFIETILPLIDIKYKVIEGIKGQKHPPFYLELPIGYYYDFVFFYHE